MAQLAMTPAKRSVLETQQKWPFMVEVPGEILGVL